MGVMGAGGWGCLFDTDILLSGTSTNLKNFSYDIYGPCAFLS